MLLRIAILVLEAYLLLGVLPWVVARILDWYLTRGAGSVPAMEQDKARLNAALANVEPHVQEKPRPGPFAEPDQHMAELAARMRRQLYQAEELLPPLQAYQGPTPTIPQALLFGGIGLLRRLVPLFASAWRLRKLLLATETTYELLLDQMRAAQDIPRQAEGQIYALRAEQQRLVAVLDSERESGTRGLEGLRQQVHEMSAALDAAEQRLRDAHDEELPHVLEQQGNVAATIGATLQQLDERVQQVVSQRQAAEQKLKRAFSAVLLLAERWEGMRARGAKDLKVSHQLHGLNTRIRALESQAKMQTIESLQSLASSFEGFERELQVTDARLDLLDGLLTGGYEGLQRANDAIARADHRLLELQREHPNVSADEAAAVLEAARAHVGQAEQEFARGTEDELARAAAMANAAEEQAQKVAQVLEGLPKRARQIRELCDAIAPSVLADRTRAIDDLTTLMGEYPQHWEDGLVDQVAHARALLQACAEERQRLPQDLLARGVLVQSQVVQVQEVLGRAVEHLNEATDLTSRLERQRDKILSQRDEVERRVEAIRARLVPEIEHVRERLLPELKQRYDALQPSLGAQLRALEDPKQTHYGRAVAEELPSLERQLFELRDAHLESVRYYRELLAKAVHDSDRTWARLQRLDPMRVPRPETDLEQLAEDMRAWRQEATANEENPRVLQELVGRRAAALMRRIESVVSEIEQGRASLANLEGQYQDIKAKVLALRTSVHERGREGEWRSIVWDTELADGAWQRAQELEREASSGTTLPTAVNAMQRAVTAASEAARLYGDIQSEMGQAVGRLEREWQTVSNKLARAARRQHSLEEREDQAAAREVGALCDSVHRAMELARAATTFEDAFRHLRDAHNHLARL